MAKNSKIGHMTNGQTHKKMRKKKTKKVSGQKSFRDEKVPSEISYHARKATG